MNILFIFFVEFIVVEIFYTNLYICTNVYKIFIFFIYCFFRELGPKNISVSSIIADFNHENKNENENDDIMTEIEKDVIFDGKKKEKKEIRISENKRKEKLQKKFNKMFVRTFFENLMKIKERFSLL